MYDVVERQAKKHKHTQRDGWIDRERGHSVRGRFYSTCVREVFRERGCGEREVVERERERSF